LARLTAVQTTTSAALKVRLVVTDEHCRPTLAQALDVRIVARIGALDIMAEVDQRFGDAGRADAANADEISFGSFMLGWLPRGRRTGPDS
jgi:hypothetical protein